MKLSEYAKLNKITYTTAYSWFKKGYLKAKQLPTGTILVDEDNDLVDENKNHNHNRNRCIIYARVNSSDQKDHIDSQIERIRNYASIKGYQIIEEYKEISSGLNDNRPKLNKILNNTNYDILLIEYKDRLTRFGFNYIEQFLNYKKQRIEVINLTEDKENILEDFISIITCYCSKIYGRKFNENRIKKLLEEVNNDN